MHSCLPTLSIARSSDQLEKVQPKQTFAWLTLDCVCVIAQPSDENPRCPLIVDPSGVYVRGSVRHHCRVFL